MSKEPGVTTKKHQTKRKAKKPWFKKPSLAVSRRMKRVKSSDTTIEKVMGKLLKRHKIKYRRQINLPGCPDFKINETNVLIFCDSSFWHGRRKKETSGKAFKKNKGFWTTKLVENKTRDVRINRVLKRSGWRVLRFWDTDILKHQDKIIKKLTLAISNNA